MDPPRARPARSRGGPTRRRLPIQPTRPREPGGLPRADRRTLPGWPSRYRNASEPLLTFSGHRRCEGILDPAVEDQICAVEGDRRIGDDQGSDELADAKISYGLYTGPEDLGGYADHQPVDQPCSQERGDHLRPSFHQHRANAPLVQRSKQGDQVYT